MIHEISVYWPVGDGDLTGLQANLVVYYDADGDGDPTNAVRIGTDMLVPVAVTGNFETYQTDFSIPGGGVTAEPVAMPMFFAVTVRSPTLTLFGPAKAA